MVAGRECSVGWLRRCAGIEWGGTIKVGDRARHLEDAIVGAGAEI